MIPLFWYDHVLVVVMVLLIAGAVRQQKKIEGVRFSPREKLVVYFANGLALWGMALVTLAAWWWGERKFADIGIRYPDPSSATCSTLLSGLILGVWMLDFGWKIRAKALASTRREWAKNTPFMPDSAKEIVWFVPLAISAGICEEVVFRGYLIRYFESLTGAHRWSSLLAILVPALVFAWGHRYQKWTAMIKIFLLAIAFGLLFSVSGSLLWCALIHIAIDFAAALVSPYLWADNAQSAVGVIDRDDPGSHPRIPGDGSATVEGNRDRESSPSDPATSDHPP